MSKTIYVRRSSFLSGQQAESYACSFAYVNKRQCHTENKTVQTFILVNILANILFHVLFNLLLIKTALVSKQNRCS